MLIDQLGCAKELKGDAQKEEKLSSPPQRYGECVLIIEAEAYGALDKGRDERLTFAMASFEAAACVPKVQRCAVGRHALCYISARD